MCSGLPQSVSRRIPVHKSIGFKRGEPRLRAEQEVPMESSH